MVTVHNNQEPEPLRQVMLSNYDDAYDNVKNFKWHDRVNFFSLESSNDWDYYSYKNRSQLKPFVSPQHAMFTLNVIATFYRQLLQPKHLLEYNEHIQDLIIESLNCDKDADPCKFEELKRDKNHFYNVIINPIVN